MASEDYRSAQGVMRDVLVRAVNEDYVEEMARVQCSTRLFWGERDTADRVLVIDVDMHRVGEQARATVKIEYVQILLPPVVGELAPIGRKADLSSVRWTNHPDVLGGY